MSTDVLGSANYSLVPTVNGNPLVVNNGNVPSLMSGPVASMPAAGTVGAIYFGTDTRLVYRDTGSGWQVISPSSVTQTKSGNIPAISSTSIIPYDNTTPQSTEGTQIWTDTITPTFASSKIQINMALNADSNNSARNITVAIFRGTTCIGVNTVYIAAAAHSASLAINIDDQPGTPGVPVTYSARAGSSGSGTWYINQGSTAVFNGLLANNGYTLMEVN